MKFVGADTYKSHIRNPVNISIYGCMTKVKLQFALIQYIFPAWRHQLQQTGVNPPVNIEFRCPLRNDPQRPINREYCVNGRTAISIGDIYRCNHIL